MGIGKLLKKLFTRSDDVESEINGENSFARSKSVITCKTKSLISQTSQIADDQGMRTDVRVKQELINLDQLEGFDNFVRDADFKRENIPRWEVGRKLQKDGAILIGTSRKTKPKYKVRFNIFAKDAFRAVDGIDDPWNLVSVDRDAFFSVADVYNHGDVVQLTLIEITQEQQQASCEYVLDEEAKNAVRRSLIESYFSEIPAYTNDELYKRLMGNDFEWYRSNEFWEIDNSDYDSACIENSIEQNDPRTEILQQFEHEGRLYCLFVELSEKAHTPEIYRQVYIAKATDDRLKIIGIGQALFACLCDTFIENCHIRKEPAVPILKITNKAKLASGNINLLNNGGKSTRIASWVKDQNGEIIVNYLEGYEQQRGEFSSFYDLLLYLFVLVAYPHAKKEEEQQARRARALRLDDGIEYEVLKLTNGLFRVQSLKREDNWHPSLEYIESQMNARVILHSILEKHAIESLYKGELFPTYQMIKDSILESIWLNPLSGLWFAPKPANSEKEYLQAILEMIEEEQSPEVIKNLNDLAEELHSAFNGDVKVCVDRIHNACNKLLFPFRLTFSLSFDEDLNQIRVNLFLPEPELFPSFTVKNRDPSSYKPSMLDPCAKRRKYAEFLAALSMLMITMIKSCCPWPETISLNAWIRRCNKWECIGAGEFQEDRILRLVEEDQLKALSRMKSIGFNFEKTKDNKLEAIEPCFSFEDGIDFRFGFDEISPNGLMPRWFPVFQKDRPFQSLEIAIERFRGLDDSEIKPDMTFTELHEIADDCYVKAMIDNSANSKIYYCMSDMEEELLRRDPEYSGAIISRSNLSVAYAFIGGNLFEQGDYEEAEKMLNLSLELNPAEFYALHELVALSIMKKNWDEAKSILSQCYRFAWNNKMVSFVLRQYGFINVEEGYLDIAKDLFICALALDQSDENVNYCMNELMGIGALDDLNGKKIEINLEESRQRVSQAGYPVKLSESTLNIVMDSLNMMLSKSKYPDRSVGDAFLSLMIDPDEAVLDNFGKEDASKLFESVLGAKLGIAPIFDYIFKPVVFTSKEFCLPVLERAEIYDEDAAVVCIPYIDKKMGFMLKAVMFVDDESFKFKKLLNPHQTIKIKDYMGEYLTAYLRDYEDYPEVNILAIAEELMKDNQLTEGVDKTRSIRAIDDLRDLEMPDNIMVVVRKEGHIPEALWAEAIDVVNEEIIVRLLSTPYDDFGVKKGDTHPVMLERTLDSEKTIAYIDCDSLVFS